jgi:hypothetical protein
MMFRRDSVPMNSRGEVPDPKQCLLDGHGGVKALIVGLRRVKHEPGLHTRPASDHG